MEGQYSKITIRESRQKKTVKIGSKLKPEIVSEVIQKWQFLIDVTAKIVNVPSGLIMKLHKDTIGVYVKSNTDGNPYVAGEEAKLIYGSYCETVIGTQKHLLVPDATKSSVWKDYNPDVDINMISYLGLPINWPDGEVFGTVCLLDNKENNYNQDYIDLLGQVKSQIETDLQLLVANKQLVDLNRDLQQTDKSTVALQNTDKRFRIIFEKSLAVMLLIEPETRRIVAANNAAEKFYGWKRSEIEKMRIDDINTLSASEIKAEMEKARKSERIYFRFKHRLANGEIRDVEVYSGKVEIDGKDYLHSIIHDITEQVNAGEALKNNDRILRLFVEHSPAAIAMFDKQMRYLVYSRRFLTDYDLGERDITGMTHYEVFPDIPQHWKDIHNRCMNGETFSADNDPFPRLSGKLDWIRWEIHPWFENNNEIGGIILLSEVITDKKNAEEALRKSEERFRVAQDFSPDGFSILHPLRNEKNEIVDFTWVYENQTIARINKTDPDDVTGKRLLDLFPAHKGTSVFATYINVANSGKPKILEEIYVGEVVSVPTWLRLVVVPMEEDIAILAQNITERKKAELELAESEERLRLATEQANVAVWDYDFNSNSMSRSGNHDKLYGLEWQTKWDINTFLNATHPEDREYSNNYIMNSVAPGGPDDYSFNFRVVFPDNSIRWLLVNGRVIERMESGQGIKVRGTLIDITEIKKAEQALSHSHELMKYIIEHNQSAVAVHDKNLNYVYVSQRYLNDYGITEKNIIGKHHYVVFPDIPEKWRKVHQKALRGIVSKADEDKYIREDGSTDWTRWECRPWYEADGSIGGIIIYTEVINEQKRKEEEIKKLNHRLEILIDSIQQLSSVQSLDSVQDIVAKSARKLIGADGATLVFRENDHCFYRNEDAIQPLWKGKKFPMNSCISGWVMENKESVVIEDVFTDDRIPKEVYSPTFVKSLAMVPVNISEPIGAIGNYWKETYTPTETELQLLQTLADAAARAIENINLYAELEERVKKRTDQLNAANKELETFTYSVSHDLKAPLRGIDGYSRLLLEEYGDSLDKEAARFIQTIRSSTLHMNQLIEDLLSYSQLERSHFKQEKIALKSFMKTLVSNFREEIKKCGFQVKINMPEVDIVTDSTGLSIALRNFMENAIKFTCESRNPEIEIGFDEKPGYWVISVKDNGVGFDMKYHDRIFEIFQRLHRAEDFPGTGIGLAMVTKALQRMGGKAWAESIPGEGSTFLIEIPKTNSK